MESRRPQGLDLINADEFAKQAEKLFPKRTLDDIFAQKLAPQVAEGVTGTGPVEEVVAHPLGTVIDVAGRRYEVQPDGSWRKIG